MEIRITSKTYRLQIMVYTSVIACIAMYLYHPFNLFFLADDFLHIPASAKNFWIQRNSLRPVGNFSLHIDYIISQKNPIGYHISNLVIHLLNSGLVFFSACKIFSAYQTKYLHVFSFVASVFFFTYPFHSESVYWIIGRSGSLGALFFLLALLFLPDDKTRIVKTIMSLIFFELALLSYESSWIFPLIVLVIAAYKTSTAKLSRYFIIYLLLVFVVFLAHLFIRYAATNELFNQYDAVSFLHLDIPALLLNYTKLLGRTLVPPFYDSNHFVIAVTILSGLLLYIIYVGYKRNQLTALFSKLTIWWVLSYLPYLSIGIDTHGVEGERYLYLPSFFFIIWLMNLFYCVFALKIALAITSFILLVNIFFLQQSRSYYEKAGMISSETINQIDNFSHKERIFIYQLPQNNKGAVVFRIGLEDAVKWLCKKPYQDVLIVSIDDSDIHPKKKNTSGFNVHLMSDTLTKQITSIYVADRSFKKNYVLKQVNDIQYHPNSDAAFVFSDTALIINH